MATLTLKQVDIKNFTMDQLETARKRSEISNKNMTYDQFIMLCKILLEYERRMENP